MHASNLGEAAYPQEAAGDQDSLSPSPIAALGKLAPLGLLPHRGAR